MRRVVRIAAPGLIACAIFVAACSPGVWPTVTVHTATLPANGPCTVESTTRLDWTNEVESFRLTLDAPDLQSPIVTTDNALTLEGVPVGTGRTVALFGLSQGARLWRGVVRDVTIEQDAVLALDVLLARVADVSCARGADQARAFHTATVLADGSILVVGGAETSVDASQTCNAGCRRLEATAGASVYNPRTGLFKTVGSLARPRMFHTATALADGRVVVAGGAARALVHGINDPAWPFPIEPLEPVDDVEVFDPKRGEFSAGGKDPGGPRIFAAAAATGDGEVWITGGVPGAQRPRNDLGNATNTTTLCGGTPFSCREGPVMASRRAGHVAFRVDGGRDIAFGGIMLWGGSIDTAPVNGIDGFQLEGLRDGDTRVQLLNVTQMFASRNLFFGAGARYVDFRMLLAGGLVRSPDGTFRPATVDIPGADPSAPVFVFDPTAGASGAIVVAPLNGTPMHLTGPRAFAAAAPLPGRKRAVIAGGYGGLDFVPSLHLEIFDEEKLEVAPLAVGGVPRTLREPRGGAVAAANGDGTLVIFGGEVPVEVHRAPVGTAEIFADPMTPPGVAE